MLNNRCSDILKLIINSNDSIVINDIAEKYNISSRTVRYDLDRIDEYLKEMNLTPLIRKQNEGISVYLSEKEINKLLDSLKEVTTYGYVMSQNERVIYIICELLEKNEYTTINSLADKMFVSRGTINNDLKEVRKLLKKKNISLESVKGKGLKAVGEEVKLRSIASNIMFESSNVTNLFNINLIKMFKDMDIEFISNLIKAAEKQMGNTLSDYSFNNLVIHIAISIKRIQLSKDIIMDEEELNNLIRTPEFSIASGIAKMLEERYLVNIPKSEIGYIAIHLLGSNVMIKEQKNDDLVYIQLIVSTLIENVNRISEYNFNSDAQLFDGLIQHIRPMIYRVKHGININNPLIDEIMSKYNNIFNTIKEGIDFLNRDLNVDISKEEIGYLTLHFMAALERVKNSTKTKARVLVVCATGVGTSKFLSMKLKSIFDIDIVDTISSHDVKKIIKNENIDLIVSTIPINLIGIKIIIVNAFLTEKNISELSLFLSNWSITNNKGIHNNKLIKNEISEEIITDEIYSKNLESKRIAMENILAIINKNCIVNDYYELKRDLSSCLTIYNIDEKPLLKDIINSCFIKLNEEASNWEEAVRKGGEILKENGCINNSYIDSMIDNVKKIGSYIVILPGIAMPHSRPEDGAFKIGFSIMTLKNPIHFGNSENDPVKLVITMSVVDKKSHVNSLKELMKIIEDDEFMDKISSATTKEDILKIFV